LLIDAGYNVERAANNFFEGKFRKTTHDMNKVALAPKTFIGDSSKSTQPHPSSGSQIWLIGRRVTLGYTLTGGNAIRSQGMIFKFEGLLHGNKLSNKPKKTPKFSGANLLFECPLSLPLQVSKTIQKFATSNYIFKGACWFV
jgi:hypothetical protein